MLVEDRASVEAVLDERDLLGSGSTFGSIRSGADRLAPTRARSSGRFATGSAMPCVRLSSSGWRSARARSRSGEAGSRASSVSSFVWGLGPWRRSF